MTIFRTNLVLDVHSTQKRTIKNKEPIYDSPETKFEPLNWYMTLLKRILSNLIIFPKKSSKILYFSPKEPTYEKTQKKSCSPAPNRKSKSISAIFGLKNRSLTVIE